MQIRMVKEKSQLTFHRDYRYLKIFRTRFARTIAFFIFFLFILPENAWAQNDANIHSYAMLAEKIYLQLDRKTYTNGDIVWFKSIVLNAFNHIPSTLSGVLYVEMIRPDETLQEKKIIQINDGFGQGFFYLDKSVKEGVYLIRAYTQWNRNFKSDFFFKEYIQVFSPEEEQAEKTIDNVSLKKETKPLANARNDGFPDLQFFPESGELVHGLSSKIGFKALASSGKGEVVKGDIIDENDSIVALFESNFLGMGTFGLHKADSTKTYYARLKSLSSENEVLLYPLPGVASKGNKLSVERQGDNILLSAFSNYLRNDSIILSLSFRGVRYYEIRANIKEGNFNILIPNDSLPEGIILFTMKDHAMRTVAERLFFNERPESRLYIDVSFNKNAYARRELTNLTITTTNSNGEPIRANVSILVINQQLLGEIQSMRQNILSYFLLDSELKGEIENPGFYFMKESDRHTQLDALLLTQGWRKYNYTQENRELVFQPETNLTVSGQIGSLFSRNKKKQAIITMVTFGENQSVYTQAVDSLGKFHFNLNDEYGDNINVLIQTSKNSDRKMNYTVTLDAKEFPPVSFNHKINAERLDSSVQPFVKKNIEKKKIEDALSFETGSILLDEVEVKSYRLTPNRKKVMEEYGEPDEVIDGKEILEKEEKWSYGLYSVLLFNYPDKVWIDRDENGILRANLYNREMTLVVIDGVPVKNYEYHLIPNIPPSEVSSFEIIEYAKNFLPLYCEVYSGGCANAPAVGNVIAIYTYGQKGIYGAKKSVGIMQTSIPVFSATREFYAPKYESQQSHDWVIPDLRALVHWDPVVETDGNGKASVSFYNADNVGKMLVIIEAVSENGEIGYQEIEYEIEGKDKQIIIVE